MTTLTRGERFKDARNVHNKNGKQTMNAVEQATGVYASLISALENDNSDRSVGYDKVAILAKHYGVSADWLLCLTEDPAPKPCAADELGLCQKSIDILSIAKEMVATHKYIKGPQDIDNSKQRLIQIMDESGYFDMYQQQVIREEGILLEELIDMACTYSSDLADFIDEILLAIVQDGNIMNNYRNYRETSLVEQEDELDNNAISFAEISSFGRLRALTNKEYVRYISNEIAKSIDRHFVERHINGNG